jgi:peptidoglycan hydrolase-like protein with peptidoglycan-binding domain
VTSDLTRGGTPEADTDAPGTPLPAPRRRRRPLRTLVVALGVLAALGAGAAAATGALGGDGSGGGSGGGQAAAPSALARTAQIRQATLTRSQTVDGTLGYGDATTVQAPGGRPGGTVTWLPAEGAVITRGKPVYRVDDQDVPLLYGDTPLYRPLKPGTEGDDVRELERNLAALGYSGFTADGTYTDTTAAAVEAWQDDLGRARTGTVLPGDAVVAAGARRVARVAAAAGAPPAGEVLAWTGTRRSVTVDLDTAYEDLVAVGTKAEITLPDGTTTAATVTSVGTAATAGPDSGGGQGSGRDDSAPDATLPVELSVRDQKALGALQAAPVDVRLTAESRRGVLAVPVEALVALPGGGYAVQTAGPGGTVRDVPVRTGMFADGMVEVSGAGIHAGLAVGVPK